jgi:very-short-patch-repair endonuclease
MLTVKNKALYKEAFNQLYKIDRLVQTEPVYSHIMPTKRRFRADFLCPTLKIMVEINGGVFVNGRHTRGGGGYETDLIKLNLAQMNGFKVFQFTYQMLEKGELNNLVNEYLYKMF